MKNNPGPLHPDHEVDDAVLRFGIEALQRSRVPRAEPVSLNPELTLPNELPEQGIGAQAALQQLAEPALQGAAQLHHPGYFAHMDPPTPSVAWVAALWQVAANQNLLHPDAAPVAREVERRLVDWIAPFFHMDGGHLVPGSTIANFTAIWAARELRGVRRVIASDRAHLSARKAADILGLSYQPVASCVDHRMVVGDYSSLGDLGDAVVVLTAGTVATGAIDELTVDGAGWVHVDAAWGGPLRFSRRHSGLLDGLQNADSVGFSAHKWCYQQKGTAVILFNDTNAAHQIMSYGGGYLSAPNIGLLGSAPANALPFAATLLAWGRTGLAKLIEDGMDMAVTFAGLIDADDRFELWGPPTTGIVVWRPRHIGPGALRDRLQDAWVSLTDIDGEVWLRCVAANPSADPEWVMQRVIAALE
ncbi:MAG: aspartate aminotransferase family protein [Chromatiales bacterium]|jgi:L-2,4-diaminobutyrate decarboxylase|nr:aspartate aminotransferase family protein [Chromatiales bacterium]